MPAKSDEYAISIRQAARMVGKTPNTLSRWRESNPVLFQAVMEWCSMNQDMASK